MKLRWKSPWITLAGRSATFLTALVFCSCTSSRPPTAAAQRGRIPLGEFPPVQTVNYQVPGNSAAAGQVRMSPVGTARVDAAPPVQRVSHTIAQNAAMRQMPGLGGMNPAECLPGRACLEDCMPVDERRPICNTDCTATEGPEWLAQRYPDEYLFDGGDRGLPVHYDTSNILGLETEDTIAEYRDDAGKRKVKPTNRVAIYAPRFAAVTSMSSPSEGLAVGRLAGTEVALHGVGLKNQQVTSQHVQNDMTERLEVRVRGSELGGGLGQAAAGQSTAIVLHDRVQGSFEESNSQQTGQYQQTAEALLASSIHSAVTWTREQNPVMSAHSSASGEVHTRFTANEYVGLEEPIRRKGDLRIVKLADKATAAAGEIVSFTIRYDNLGDLELNEVAIVDNLTPRLEYVADSAESEHLATFVTTDNGEGSLVLRWALEDPVPGHTSGVMKFKARVR